MSGKIIKTGAEMIIVNSNNSKLSGAYHVPVTFFYILLIPSCTVLFHLPIYHVDIPISSLKKNCKELP